MKTFVSFGLMSNSSIVELRPEDKAWPKLLSEIPNPPKKLYCRGNINILTSYCLAVVGTRKLTSYGKDAVQHIVRDLVNNGFIIVSGLALGIDAVAHQTTLDYGGKTIAVLGGGVGNKNIGPRTNFPLAQNILKNDGLLISEYSDEKEIYPINFAIRDRIISGVSMGVLVVEAGEGSGALITAQCALEQNRDIFAIPGNIFSSKSFGPNLLIRRGAVPVTSAHDIINEYNHNPKLFKNIQIVTDNPIEKKILEVIWESNELNADEIIRAIKIPTDKVVVALSTLEINGKIKNLGNGKYRKI